jgi:hypothetical protein
VELELGLKLELTLSFKGKLWDFLVIVVRCIRWTFVHIIWPLYWDYSIFAVLELVSLNYGIYSLRVIGMLCA